MVVELLNVETFEAVSATNRQAVNILPCTAVHSKGKGCLSPVTSISLFSTESPVEHTYL